MTTTLKIKTVNTKPYNDQKMGTSGLRKKVKDMLQDNYIENFLQSVFNAYDVGCYKGKTLIIGGDGRYGNKILIQKALKLAMANGVSKIIIGENGLLSTPSVSLLVRAQPKDTCFGAFIVTSSHNPGGPNEDMGIKVNSENGGAIPEHKNTLILDISQKLTTYNILDYKEDFSLTKGTSVKVETSTGETYNVDIVIENTTQLYVNSMKQLFDFDLIKTLFDRKDFHFVFDGLHGISGPYAIEIFHNNFGVPMKDLLNCNPLPDFGGFHPDPNLVHAKNLVQLFDIFNKKPPTAVIPEFGAACDGDADRYMIVGPRTFVIPSDSVAVLAANANIIKTFNREGTLKGVARSLPTSSALDRVATKIGIPSYEVPTGWKFFGNLLDANKISLCGEEAFGTGGTHVREKDGLWAILCWLSILAYKNKNNNGKLFGVKDVLLEHWKTYGRDYYIRYDFENLNGEQTAKVKENVTKSIDEFNKKRTGNKAYIFEYEDPVDGLISKNQGWIFKDLERDTRICVRVSGTATTNATIRMYFEKHIEPNGKLLEDVETMLKGDGNDLPQQAIEMSDILNISGKTKPDVVT